MQQDRDIVSKYVNIHILDINNTRGLLGMWTTVNKARGRCFGVLLDASQERNLREMDIRKSARGTDISNLSLY